MASLGTTFPGDVIPLAGQGGVDTLLAWVLAIATYSYMLSVQENSVELDGRACDGCDGRCSGWGKWDMSMMSEP